MDSTFTKPEQAESRENKLVFCILPVGLAQEEWIWRTHYSGAGTGAWNRAGTEARNRTGTAGNFKIKRNAAIDNAYFTK